MTDPDWPTLEWIEREYIEARLNHFGGNKTQTAKSLGIALSTLHLWLAKYERAGVPVRVVSKAPELSVQRANEARLELKASKAARGLIDAPLAAVVPMSAKDKRVRLKATKPRPRKSRRMEPLVRWLEIRL